MSKELTLAQKRILDFIRTTIAANGYPPTRNEIANAMDYRSANAAHEHLLVLQRKGYVKLIPGISRGIQLTSMPTEQISMMDVLADTCQPLRRSMLSLK